MQAVKLQEQVLDAHSLLSPHPRNQLLGQLDYNCARHATHTQNSSHFPLFHWTREQNKGETKKAAFSFYQRRPEGESCVADVISLTSFSLLSSTSWLSVRMQYFLSHVVVSV